MGVFVAYNSRGGNAAREKLLAAFLDRYYPDQRPPSPLARAGASPDGARFAGTYVFNRRVRRGLETIASQGDTLTIRSLPAALVLGGNRFVPEAPLLFRREDGKSHLAFKEDEQGRITHVFTGAAIARVYERRRWHEAPGLHLAAAALCVLAFVWTCVASLRNRLRPRQPIPALQPWAGRMATLVSVLNLGFAIGFAILLARFAEDLEYRVPPALIVLLTIPLLTTALTIALLVFSGRTWLRRPWPFDERSHYIWVTLAALGWVLLLHYWNLLGFRY